MHHRALVAITAISLAFTASLVLGAPTPRGRTPPPPPPPPPAVTFSLDAPQPDRGWAVTFTNTGTDPVRIVADPRLVSFDVTAQGHDHHCTLPADMVPTTDTERTLVVPGNRSWTIRIEPLLYCFTSAQAAALTPGAVVTANFGWPAARYAPPFAVIPTTVLDGGVGPARRVSGAPVTLAAVQVAAVDGGMGASSVDASVSPPTPPDAYPVRLKAALPERLDVSRAFEQSVTVTVSNEGDRPVRTLINQLTVGFYVHTPSGYILRCGAEMAVSAIAELTTTLAAHGHTTVTVDLGTTCGSLMRQPGLYRINPRLDTRRVMPPVGSAAGAFWNGEVIGGAMLMRIRGGEDALPAPRLDPAVVTK